jgi:hypothetical protein
MAKRPKPEWLKKLQWVVEMFDRFCTANVASFDENAKRVLGRLKADDRVPEALAAIAKSESDLNRLLSGCLESDELLRTFGETLNKERRIIEQAKRLQLNLEELKTFFDEELWSYDHAKIGATLKDRTYIDRLSARISIDNQDIQMINHSIYVFKELIADRQRVASETILRFGATRKSARTNRNAAQTAAIGWLAEAVERIAGRPLTRHAAVLAEATLAIRDITEDRVREALRTRRREWRADR